MSPAIAMRSDNGNENEKQESQYQRGVKHLCENGVSKVPDKYILPILDRPTTTHEEANLFNKGNLKLPVIDFAELQGSNRPQVLKSLANACEQYGFFQVGVVVVNLNYT